MGYAPELFHGRSPLFPGHLLLRSARRRARAPLSSMPSPGPRSSAEGRRGTVGACMQRVSPWSLGTAGTPGASTAPSPCKGLPRGHWQGYLWPFHFLCPLEGQGHGGLYSGRYHGNRAVERLLPHCWHSRVNFTLVGEP